jgi:ADP-ribose pyrophosphatase
VAEDEILLRTRRFNVVRREYRTDDGKLHQREIVEHPGAVAVIPRLDDGRICLIENYRVAVGQTLIELPTGTREPGEDPAVTAVRELREETGFEAAHVQRLHAFWVSPGILNERLHLYLATGLTPSTRQLDEGEQIVNRIVTCQEAIELVRSGMIEDAKTLVGLLYYEQFVRSRPH